MNVIWAYLRNRGTWEDMLREKDTNPKGKSEILKILSGADEAVVVMILSDKGRGAKGFT
jgi:hypothetical protein